MHCKFRHCPCLRNNFTPGPFPWEAEVALRGNDEVAEQFRASELLVHFPALHKLIYEENRVHVWITGAERADAIFELVSHMRVLRISTAALEAK